MEKIKGYKGLIVWQKSILLTDTIYAVTKSFPKEEIYGLTSQIRRSAVSVPSNIAEGSSRHGTSEFIQFLSIVKASLAEVDTQLIIAEHQNYISAKQMKELDTLITEIDAMLYSLILTLKRKKS